MAEEDARIKVIDHCRVSLKSPPSSSPISITLSPLDIPWTCIIGDATHQAQQILLYQFPNTYTNDLIHHQVIPSLKTSLSLALEHFYPYASKLVFPPFPEKPRIVYTDGDSVSFTVVESTMDFGELVGDQMKDVKLFHALIPSLSQQILSSEDHDGTWIFPDLLAIQVTVFPESRGLCIGIHVNHTVGDGTGFAYFFKSWASICGTNNSQLVVPILNRDVIEDATGLQTIQLWKEWSLAFPRGPVNSSNPPPPPPSSSAAELVRATFILSKTSINRLKHWIILNQQQPPTLSNISSFAAACAFTWICFLKSKQEEVDDHKKGIVPEEECEFLFTADVRTRLKIPAPETFFGNCVVPCSVYIKKNELLGKNGIVYAAKAISDKVKELDGGAAVRSAVETWLSYTKDIQPDQIFTVAGSPRMAVYDMDFGWGRPKKCEIGHIDAGSIVSLSQSRSDEDGGLEIGVALKRIAMNKFTTLFQGLKESFII